MERRDVPGAITFLRRAIAADPANALARSTLARILIGMQQLEEAHLHLRTALDRKPLDIDARLTLAVLFATQGRTTEAMTEVTHVLAQEPTHRQALELRDRLSHD
jgi:predicted Zn-dependent protease